jgi:hypothetical protein
MARKIQPGGGVQQRSKQNPTPHRDRTDQIHPLAPDAIRQMWESGTITKENGGAQERRQQ